MKINMIDVSVYQGEIDWKKVKDSGIEAAVIKCSQGGTNNTGMTISPFEDLFFQQNIKGAIESGIRKIGVYHYLAGTTVDAVKKEAAFVLSTIEYYKAAINLFVAVDLEDVTGFPKYSKIGRSQNAALIDAFCSVIRDAGYTPALYTNKNFLTNYIERSGLGLGSEIELWYARWGVEESVALREESEMIAWQTTSTIIPGIVGLVDGNVYYKKNEEDEDVERWATINDVPKGYYRDQVSRLMDAGIIVGKEDGTIDLTEDMLRGILMGERFMTTARWTSVDDVPKGAYQNNVRRLIKSGVIAGKEDGSIDLTEDMLRTLLMSERLK